MRNKVVVLAVFQAFLESHLSPVDELEAPLFGIFDVFDFSELFLIFFRQVTTARLGSEFDFTYTRSKLEMGPGF